MQDAEQKVSYRYEIQAIRIISIITVAIYHFWIYGISGGVDLFICISGYFMVMHYYKVVYRNSKYFALSHLLSIIRRLIPQTFLFLFAIMLIGNQIFDLDLQQKLFETLKPSVLYATNYSLIDNSYNYVDRTSGINPLVHLWAVSVIGQLSVVSVLVFWLADRFGNKRIVALSILLGVLFSCSLLFSIINTQINPTSAYFGTITRAYEFYGGGLIAIATETFSCKKNNFLAICSFLLFFCIGPTLGMSKNFPGWAGLSCLLVGGLILFFYDPNRWPILESFFRTKYVVLLSKSTFAFYLWHWPLYVAVFSFYSYSKITLFTGCCLLFLSCFIAYFHFKFSLFLVALFKKRDILIYFIVGVAIYLYSSIAQNNISDRIQTLSSIRKDTHYQIKPQEVTKMFNDDSLIINKYGDHDAQRVIYLVGASHTDNWVSFFDRFGKENGYRVEVIIKLACYFAEYGDQKTDCARWQKKVIDYINSSNKYDKTIVTTFTNIIPSLNGATETVPKEKSELIKKYHYKNYKIIGIRDTPRLKVFFDPVKCNLQGKICKVNKELVMNQQQYEILKKKYNYVHFVDFNQVFSDSKYCLTNIDGAMVFADWDGHLSEKFVSKYYSNFKNILIKSANFLTK